MNADDNDVLAEAVMPGDHVIYNDRTWVVIEIEYSLDGVWLALRDPGNALGPLTRVPVVLVSRTHQ